MSKSHFTTAHTSTQMTTGDNYSDFDLSLFNNHFKGWSSHIPKKSVLIGLFVFLFTYGFCQDITYSRKVEGMLIGTMIGDAAGGPYEFKWPPSRNTWSMDNRTLSSERVDSIADAFKLISYIREEEPYGQWIKDAPKGSITDDTRLKLIFLSSLSRKGDVSVKRFAKALINYPETVKPAYEKLANQWLEQFIPSALFVSGKTKDPRAKPPETIWAGVPTNLGQMTFTPLAAIHPDAPEVCYLKTWEIDYFDFGSSKDMHASIIAGLSHAYNDTATWDGIKDVMRKTDPYNMNSIPWAKRRTAYWINFAEEAAQSSEGNIAKLFDILQNDMQAIQWWDTWVPLVIMIAIGELTDYNPLATLQLSLEFGYDTDSYAQLIGAFMGALHGPDIFGMDLQRSVKVQLKKEYNTDFQDLVAQIVGLK